LCSYPVQPRPPVVYFQSTFDINRTISERLRKQDATGSRFAGRKNRTFRESESASMAQSRESLEDVVALESESTEEVQAAISEKDRGGPGVSIGLLLGAIEKERDSLELMEQTVETFRLALEQRRRSLELQQQMLLELSDTIQTQGIESEKESSS
jgi:hypothetical protein